MSRVSDYLRILSAAVLLTITGAQAYADATAPRRELRSAWVTTAWALDWPSNKTSQATQQAEAITILDNLKAMGANCVYFQVRSMNDRYYNRTSYSINGTNYAVYNEKRSSYLAGDWDALEYWLDAAHARGMELYAWINPYRVASTQSAYDAQGLPDSMKSWIIKSKTSADNAAGYTDIWIYNPALVQTTSRIRNICMVLAGNYDIDGIVFDDYFYPDRISIDDNNNASPDQAQYDSYRSGGGSLSKADWRRKNINDMVKTVNDAIHSVKPWVKFGISPAGVAYKGLANFSDETATALPSAYGVTTDDWQYDGIFSDPIHWVHERTVDFISPQIYWQYNAAKSPFKGCCEWWTRFAKRHDVHFYASHSVSYVYFASSSYNGQAGYDLEKLKIDCVRKEGGEADAPFGSVFYSMRGLMDGVRSLMAGGVYRYKALTPEFTVYGSGAPRGNDPGTVTGLWASYNGASVTRLNWTTKAAVGAALGNGTGAMRYSVYAIPVSVYTFDAADDDGGIKAQYLLGVTYGGAMDIPGDKGTGHYYVVRCLDRYGHEWEPSYYGDVPVKPEPLAKPALLRPADGVRLTADTEFAVENVMEGYPGEKTVIQISRSPGFGSVQLEYTGTVATVPYADISEPGTYYWRARVDRGGVESVYSDIRSFVVIADALAKPELFRPLDGITLSEATNFVASLVTDSSTDTELQIFDNAGCQGVPVLSSNVWCEVPDAQGKIWLQHRVDPYELGNGRYWWRVYCTRKGTGAVSSETRAFAVGNGIIEKGYLTEEGYVQSKDITTDLVIDLASGKKADLQSLWIRKADISPFGDFGADGDIRDICVRPADSDQARDIVYLSSKTTTPHLVRIDARTGENVGDINLSFDQQWGGTYPVNGLSVDRRNRLYVHTLAAATSKFCVGVVTHIDESSRTASVKTLLAYTDPTYRFDHARVYGDLMEGTGYIMAVARSGNTNCAYRWTVHQGTVDTSSKTCVGLDTYSGIVPYIHPLSENKVLLKASNNSAGACLLADITGGNTLAASTLPKTKAGGVTAFRHGGGWFMVVPARDHQSDARSASGMAWGICALDDPASGFSDERMVTEMPASDYMGSVMSASADYGAPAVYMQTGHGETSATGVDNPTTTYIYGLCNQNGIAGYQLTTRITTGAEDIAADVSTGPAVYYNLQGIRMPADVPLAPGIYIRRTNSEVCRILIK